MASSNLGLILPEHGFKSDMLSPWLAVWMTGLLCSFLLHCAKRLYWHPLSSVPGPRLAACSSLWLAWHTYIGDECSTIYKLHEKYGPILRVAPNDIDISDSDAVDPIYIKHGGFEKSTAYSKFDIDGHATIFSTLSLSARAKRAKAVAPLFSTSSIRNAEPVMGQVIDDFVTRLQKQASKKEAFDILTLTRSMAIDVVSAYLFDHQYGAVYEDGLEMSASPFVDTFVGVGAFFNFFPGWLGDFLLPLLERWTAEPGASVSMKAVDMYTGNLVKTSTRQGSTFMDRLLRRGVPDTQVQVELKDLCFAGTDSTGMNMATILWNLCKSPPTYEKLRHEVDRLASSGVDITSGPYLRGVVREGLRLSWANPIRLPRAVPEGGWQYHDHFFPAGTSVGVAAFQLHQDEAVFPDAHVFRPERWLEPTEEMLTHFFAFGKGNRACIAQNLGTRELMIATSKVAIADALQGGSTVEEDIEILEWFNSKVKSGKILLQF